MTEDELNLIDAMVGTAQALQALRRVRGLRGASELARRADELALDVTDAWQASRRAGSGAEPPADYPRVLTRSPQTAAS